MKKNMILITGLFLIFVYYNCCSSEDYATNSEYEQCLKDEENFWETMATIADAIGDDDNDTNNSTNTNSGGGSNQEPLPPAVITNVSASATSITITLVDNNTTTADYIKSKILLRQASLTGYSLNFTVMTISPTQYTLNGFLLNNSQYFLTIEKAAFITIEGESQAAVFQFNM